MRQWTVQCRCELWMHTTPGSHHQSSNNYSQWITRRIKISIGQTGCIAVASSIPWEMLIKQDCTVRELVALPLCTIYRTFVRVLWHSREHTNAYTAHSHRTDRSGMDTLTRIHCASIVRLFWDVRRMNWVNACIYGHGLMSIAVHAFN